MTKPVARALLNSRNPRDRALGRQVARNPRHLPPDLKRALDLANSVLKRSRPTTPPSTAAPATIYRDGDGAATSADMGFTPTHSSVPNARRRVLEERFPRQR